MRKFFKNMEKIENIFTIICLSTLIVIVFMQTVLRYIFNSPLIWPERLATLIVIWMIYIGASIALKRESHISIKFFVKSLPNKVSRFIKILVNSSIAVFLFIVIWYGIFLQQSQLKYYDAALNIPRSIFSLPIIISAFLMLLFIIFSVYSEIKMIFIKEELPIKNKQNMGNKHH